MTAREDILTRIRGAIGDVETVIVERRYRGATDQPGGLPELRTLFVDRVADYKATTIDCSDTDDGIAAAVLSVLAARDVDRVVVPPGLAATWLSPDRRVVDRPPLTALELDRAAGVLTGCALAIAETGTVVLDGSAACGRRATTLMPDLHICVVRADQIVQSVPDAIALLDPQRPITFISGPSATSDIELERVEGVHGPRDLVVIVASSHLAD